MRTYAITRWPLGGWRAGASAAAVSAFAVRAVFRRLLQPSEPPPESQLRWVAWWEREGLDAVRRLLDEHWGGPTASRDEPFLPEALTIGDYEQYVAFSPEELAQLLGDLTEDAGAPRMPDREVAAAEAIVAFIRAAAPSRQRVDR